MLECLVVKKKKKKRKRDKRIFFNGTIPIGFFLDTGKGRMAVSSPTSSRGHILAGENVIFRGKTSFQGLMASLMKPDVKNPPSGKS